MSSRSSRQGLPQNKRSLCSDEETSAANSDIASESTSDTTPNSTTSSSFQFRVKRLKCLSHYLKDQIGQVVEAKEAEAVFEIVVKWLQEPNDSLESLLLFVRLQKCTVRGVIRQVVRQLTPGQAQQLLHRFLDHKLISGFALQTVAPNFRQLWVRECIRQFPQDVLAPEFKEKLKLLENQFPNQIEKQHKLAKLYGRLTTVLDQQYRKYIKQGNSLESLLANSS